MHGFHNVILIIQPSILGRHAPNGRVVPPTPHNISIEPPVRMRELHVPFAHTLSPPAAVATPSDPLLALTADIAIMVDAMVSSASTGSDTLIRRGEVEAIRGVGTV